MVIHACTYPALRGTSAQAPAIESADGCFAHATHATHMCKGQPRRGVDVSISQPTYSNAHSVLYPHCRFPMQHQHPRASLPCCLFFFSLFEKYSPDPPNPLAPKLIQPHSDVAPTTVANPFGGGAVLPAGAGAVASNPFAVPAATTGNPNPFATPIASTTASNPSPVSTTTTTTTAAAAAAIPAAAASAVAAAVSTVKLHVTLANAGDVAAGAVLTVAADQASASTPFTSTPTLLIALQSNMSRFNHTSIAKKIEAGSVVFESMAKFEVASEAALRSDTLVVELRDDAGGGKVSVGTVTVKSAAAQGAVTIALRMQDPAASAAAVMAVALASALPPQAAAGGGGSAGGDGGGGGGVDAASKGVGKLSVAASETTAPAPAPTAAAAVREATDSETDETGSYISDDESVSSDEDYDEVGAKPKMILVYKGANG